MGMTNNEKALELVQKCLDDWPYAATRVVDIMKRLEQVKALLKEQEAVRPVKQIEQTEWTVCSNCRNHIISKWIFCPYCGKPVKWE